MLWPLFRLSCAPGTGCLCGLGCGRIGMIPEMLLQLLRTYPRIRTQRNRACSAVGIAAGENGIGST